MDKLPRDLPPQDPPTIQPDNELTEQDLAHLTEELDDFFKDLSTEAKSNEQITKLPRSSRVESPAVSFTLASTTVSPDTIVKGFIKENEKRFREGPDLSVQFYLLGSLTIEENILIEQEVIPDDFETFQALLDNEEYYIATTLPDKKRIIISENKKVIDIYDQAKNKRSRLATKKYSARKTENGKINFSYLETVETRYWSVVILSPEEYIKFKNIFESSLRDLLESKRREKKNSDERKTEIKVTRHIQLSDATIDEKKKQFIFEMKKLEIKKHEERLKSKLLREQEKSNEERGMIKEHTKKAEEKAEKRKKVYLEKEKKHFETKEEIRAEERKREARKTKDSGPGYPPL